MKANNEYFLKHWRKTRFYLIVLIVILVGCTLAGFPEVFVPMLIICISAAIYILAKRKSTNNVFDIYLKDPTSQRFLSYYDKIFNSKAPVEDKDAWLVYNKSLVCCYYGEFDRAKELMNSINWCKRVPYIQSLEVSNRALICYLQTQDYEEGLRLAITAKNIGQVPAQVLGSQKTREFYETYVEIGRLLSGNINEDIIRSLEAKFEASPLFPQILIAWSLAIIYKKLGTVEKSKEKHEFCMKVAPYCKPVLRLD